MEVNILLLSQGLSSLLKRKMQPEANARDFVAPAHTLPKGEIASTNY
jgi:hypothetical protein